MVSGYLYHKSGKECWLSSRGAPLDRNITWHRMFDDLAMRVRVDHPPAGKRSLCQYLVDETEEMGMLVYSNFVMRRWNVAIVNMFKAIQLYEDPMHRRSLFICMEDLSHPTTKAATIERILEWFFPGREFANTVVLPEEHKVVYAGNHSTDRDPVQRERLRSIIAKIDTEVYGGALANLHEMFGRCGEKKKICTAMK